MFCKGLVINYEECVCGGGGATKWEKRGFETFRAPPPFKEWKLFAPPFFNMAKTSSYCV